MKGWVRRRLDGIPEPEKPPPPLHGPAPRKYLRGDRKRVGQHVQALQPQHYEIMDWLLVNPGKTIAECAKALGKARAIVSRVTNSPVFIEKFEKERRILLGRAAERHFERLRGTSEVILDAIEKKVKSGEASEKFIALTHRTILETVYGKQTVVEGLQPGEQKHLHLHVSPEQLAQARDKIFHKFYGSAEMPAEKKALPEPVIDVEMVQ